LKCLGKGQKLKNYSNKRKRALPNNKLIINPQTKKLIKQMKANPIRESTYSKTGPCYQIAAFKANKILRNKTSTSQIIFTPVSEHLRAKEIKTNCQSILFSQIMKAASLTVCLPCQLM
jgi:hypothetical protein